MENKLINYETEESESETDLEIITEREEMENNKQQINILYLLLNKLFISGISEHILSFISGLNGSMEQQLKTLYSNNLDNIKNISKNMFDKLFCECCQYDNYVAYYKRIGIELDIEECIGCYCCRGCDD